MNVAVLDRQENRKTAMDACPSAGNVAERLEISICDRPGGVEPLWRRLESMAAATVYQRHDWVDASLSTLDRGEKRSAFIVTGTLDGEPAFLLPLSIKGRLMRELTWAGGNHANYSCGLYSPDFLRQLGPGDFAAIMNRIRALVPGVGIIKMCCQPASWNGTANPMLELGGQRAVNQAFVMDLRDGFDALLARGNAKRKRKRFRHQERLAAAHGGYRLAMPQTVGQCDEMLAVFLAQKSARLQTRGLRDVFASLHARNFLAELVRKSAGTREPLLRLFGLEIGGKVRAVLGGGVHQNRMSAYFTSIAEDELAALSPGEMLLYLVAEQCAREGLTHIDLGAGEERYKRSWCDGTIEMFDVIIATSLPGLPLAVGSRAALTIKRMVREHTGLWNAVGALRGLRRRLAG